MSSQGVESPKNAPHPGRVVTQVPSLSALVGGHPDALRAIYEAGRPTDPAELGDAPRGRVLALGPGSDVFLLGRPLMRGLSSDVSPWKGKTFDHGGNSGQNIVFGRKALRFHVEVGPSKLDGEPTLVLSYAPASYGNPWPIRAIVDELRTVGDRIAIGPSLLMRGGEPTLLLWFGLERG